ncbi:MAG: anion transporter [Lentisphaeria bacterium]
MRALLIFLLSYVGIAFGSLPRLALDRTGFALLGAIAMVCSGQLDLHGALAAIDVGTILLLYGLMVLSAQFRLGGFYGWTARRLARRIVSPARFLLLVMLTSALFSALLMNDIVCLAFTPVLAVALRRGGWNPVPFLLGLAVASNIGSAATIIGNPQNMLIGQVRQLAFGPFVAWCLPPVLAALAVAYGWIAWLYRGRYRLPIAESAAGAESAGAEGPPFDRWQTGKGLFWTAVLLVLFFTPVPREVSALGVAGVLLCSRKMSSRDLLGLVDWHLITLFCGLFIIVRGLESTGLPAQAVAWLAAGGADLRDPNLLALLAAVLSNVVSNVPAVMLLVHFVPAGQAVDSYVLALASTFAGNLITIGSIANLIVITAAGACGVTISFRDHARVGVPVTLASLLVVLLWIRMAG